MRDQPPLLVRAVWFLFVGWWLTGLWLAAAWLLNLTLVGIPLGIALINRVPLVVSLKRRDPPVAERTTESYSWPVRAVWFVCIGWWASALWTAAAYAVTLTIVGIPVAVWMHARLPFVVSLYDY
ncbi:YccF domain-containing protein [Haloarcula halophila]|uniref:YccF domain-containing protein n=1 Tax=Haloarcula TaxID=2237 RepID=UPI0023E4108B|nr:YccF domain-containing protein [Halomicroarcula sp. DFY41]